MKKFLKLLMIVLFLLITVSCQTTKQIQLKERPKRQELPPVTDVEDMAETLAYYESLVEQWEAWADDVESQLK